MQASSQPASAVAATDVARDLLVVIRHLMRESTPEFFRALGDLELSVTQAKMLHELEERGADLPLTELAELLSLSLPAVSRAIEVLQQRGYVVRREDDQDRRVKRVRITPAGRRVLERLMRIRLKMLERFTSTLSEDERADLVRALGPLVEKAHR
ncbi:MAG: MarR family transcriptional regulator [Actinomycetota bacterium]|nr:MarR family transcriptional regulator [Actinomycetota bacterium]